MVDLPWKQIKRKIKQPIRFLAKDWALGYAFPRAYKKAIAKKSIVENKALFVDVKSFKMPDSFAIMFPYLRDELGFDVEFVGLGQNEGVGWGAYYKNCLRLMYKLAQARFVFLCDASDVVSCIPLRDETKVIQLWHACGAFKKWGISTAELKFGGTKSQIKRHPFYENLSLVTVSSPEVKWAYQEAMMLDKNPNVVQATGVSRTDIYFDKGFIESARDDIESAIPQCRGKKILLYAPTFRGHASEAVGPDELDFQLLCDALAEEWVLLVKHHPFVKMPPEIHEEYRSFASLVPEIPTEKLLCVADACITDYSSIIFEYSLFERPMLFFAYDLDEYSDWRGFYYDYEELTPGPVVRTTKEIIDCLTDIDKCFDKEQVSAFRERFMSACDGHATERIGRMLPELECRQSRRRSSSGPSDAGCLF